MNKLFRLGLLCLLLAFGGELLASTLTRLTQQEMTNRADLIVVGECIEVRHQWLGRTLFTLATITVEESLKGSAPAQLTLVIPGGVDTSLEVPIAVTFAGAPVVLARERVLLFLNPFQQVQNGFSVVGFNQGKYEVKETPAGRMAVSSHGAASPSFELDGFRRRLQGN